MGTDLRESQVCSTGGLPSVLREEWHGSSRAKTGTGLSTGVVGLVLTAYVPFARVALGMTIHG
jgi:hypothetical protein